MVMLGHFAAVIIPFPSLLPVRSIILRWHLLHLSHIDIMARLHAHYPSCNVTLCFSYNFEWSRPQWCNIPEGMFDRLYAVKSCKDPRVHDGWALGRSRQSIGVARGEGIFCLRRVLRQCERNSLKTEVDRIPWGILVQSRWGGDGGKGAAVVIASCSLVISMCQVVLLRNVSQILMYSSLRSFNAIASWHGAGRGSARISDWERDIWENKLLLHKWEAAMIDINELSLDKD